MTPTHPEVSWQQGTGLPGPEDMSVVCVLCFLIHPHTEARNVFARCLDAVSSRILSFQQVRATSKEKKHDTHTHTHLQARFDVYMSMCVSRRRTAQVSLYTLKTFEAQNMFRYKICLSMCVSAGVLLCLLNEALHRNKNT
jgi:hypothetical protein